MPSPFTNASRAEMTAKDRTWLPKLIFRAILLLFNLISIGVLAGAIVKGQQWLNDYYSDDSSSYGYGYGYGYDTTTTATTAWFFIPLGLSCIWVIVWASVLLIRRVPTHPGFAVAFDLLLSIAFLIVAGIYDTLAYYALSTTPSDDYSSSYGYNSYGSTSITNAGLDPAADAAYHHLAILAVVAGVFLSLAAIIHVILFVWACIDCHAYNRSAVYDDRARVLAMQMIESGQLRSPHQFPQQAHPLMAQDSSYQPYNPANRAAPGDLDGQYADGPRAGHYAPYGTTAYEPVKTNDPEVQPAASSSQQAPQLPHISVEK